MAPNNLTKACGTSSVLSPNTVLQSRYRILRQLGRGGMGAVYEAIDLRLGHRVAIKQTLTQDEESWKQFEQEARLMAQLNHPALPCVSDYFTEANRAFFVMQFVEGHDLAELLARKLKPLPEHLVVAWADQLLDALIYLHSRDRQIIHRDIKPHNLRVTATGRIILLDFGLAKSERSRHEDEESSRSIFGYSPRYAPLEQIQDFGTTPQSDIYALGATLYHLLTGVKPPDSVARAAALVSSRPNPLRPANEINSAVSKELADILERAMAQNPADRFGNASEFRTALSRIGRVDYCAISKACQPAGLLDDSGETTFVRPDEVARMHETWRPSPGAFQDRRGVIFGEVLGLSKHEPIPVDRYEKDPNEISSLDEPHPERRLGSQWLVALMVILMSSFGLFCHYYKWRLPADVPRETSSSKGSYSKASGPILMDLKVEGNRRP